MANIVLLYIFFPRVFEGFCSCFLKWGREEVCFVVFCRVCVYTKMIYVLSKKYSTF